MISDSVGVGGGEVKGEERLKRALNNGWRPKRKKGVTPPPSLFFPYTQIAPAEMTTLAWGRPPSRPLCFFVSGERLTHSLTPHPKMTHAKHTHPQTLTHSFTTPPPLRARLDVNRSYRMTLGILCPSARLVSSSGGDEWVRVLPCPALGRRGGQANPPETEEGGHCRGLGGGGGLELCWGSGKKKKLSKRKTKSRKALSIFLGRKETEGEGGVSTQLTELEDMVVVGACRAHAAVVMRVGGNRQGGMVPPGPPGNQKDGGGRMQTAVLWFSPSGDPIRVQGSSLVTCADSRSLSLSSSDTSVSASFTSSERARPKGKEDPSFLFPYFRFRERQGGLGGRLPPACCNRSLLSACSASFRGPRGPPRFRIKH